MRNLLCRDFHAHVAAGHHDSVAFLQNGIQIFNSFCVLNFSDNQHSGSVLLQNLLNFTDRPCIAHKGSRNVIKACLDSKQNILFILVRQSRQINFYVWYVNALFFTQLSAVFYPADNIISFYLLNVQLNQAVVDEDLVSWLYVCRKTCIIDKTSRMIAYRLLGGQRIDVSLFQSNLLSVL